MKCKKCLSIHIAMLYYRKLETKIRHPFIYQEYGEIYKQERKCLNCGNTWRARNKLQFI